MDLLSLYENHLKTDRIQNDPAQRQAIIELETLYQKIIKRKRWWMTPPKGIYLWGEVGRGKTFLMDLFFQALPKERKVRFHFHRFMHYIQQELKSHQGKVNPLKKIAKSFSKQYKVLCFDEFHVSDIGDAMILGELFKAFFESGLVIVATSNCEPQGLYPNGLQRDKFLPAIDLIYHHMQVIHLVGEKDYRLAFLSKTPCYYFPINQQVEDALQHIFEKLTFDQLVTFEPITLCERKVPVIRCAQTVIWFTFSDLCESARSSEDYIEIARCFRTVMISGLSQMGEEHESSAKRFMHLIDALYDHHVNLIISAKVPIQDLYTGRMLKGTFTRTQSRLQEMQSTNYLSLSHQMD